MASNPLKQTSSEITYTYEGTSGAWYVLTKVRVGGRYEWDWAVALPGQSPVCGTTRHHSAAKRFFQQMEEAASDAARLELLADLPDELDSQDKHDEQEDAVGDAEGAGRS